MVDITRGARVYESIKNQLRGKEGNIVAIEVESGDFFVGVDTLEACDTARKKHADKQFYLRRIGSEAAFVVGRA